MNITEELAKLEALHKSGALTDEEFAKAKATLLNPSQPAAPPPPTPPQRSAENPFLGKAIGCGVSLTILAVVAYFAVPWASKQWKEYEDAQKKASEAHEQAALLVGAGVQRLDAELNQGVFSHDLLLVNKGDDVLTEATLELVIIKEADGSKTELKQYWEKWVPGEKKKINFSASATRSGMSVVVTGFAYIKQGGESKKVQLGNSWVWHRK